MPRATTSKRRQAKKPATRQLTRAIASDWVTFSQRLRAETAARVESTRWRLRLSRAALIARAVDEFLDRNSEPVGDVSGGCIEADQALA